MHNMPCFYCAVHYIEAVSGKPGLDPAWVSASSLGKKDSMMVKIEDVQSYGKEHLETIAASASNLQSGVQAIATAYGDYAKKSFEDTKSYVEKLSGVKSLDKAMEAQTEYARSAYETFVAERLKLPGFYGDLAKQT